MTRLFPARHSPFRRPPFWRQSPGGPSIQRVSRAIPIALATALTAAWAGPAWATPASASSAGASAPQLAVVAAPGTVLTVDGRPYAGSLVLAPAARGVTVVNRVGFEQYVAGIGEMPSNWPAAALQAQAVAARTYALWTVLTSRPGPGGGQICATDACQVYAGLGKTEGPDGARWAAAVRATSGQVLEYQGRVIEALYGSSDGGQTVSGGVPWLASVPDPDDALAPEHSWSWTAPLATLAPLLAVPAGARLSSLVSSPSAVTETLSAPGGAVTRQRIDPSRFHALINSGLAAPPGLDLPLPSWRYSVSTTGRQVTVQGWGDGEGLGLSQYGALGKAMRGWSAPQILADYYRGTTVAALAPGPEPAEISVTLLQAPSAVIGATGPARIVGPGGRVIASTTGPAAWAATSSGPGVALAPEPGSGPLLTLPTAGDTAPVPARPAAPRPLPSAHHTTTLISAAGPATGQAPASGIAVTAAFRAGRIAAPRAGTAGRGPIEPWGVAAVAVLLAVIAAAIRLTAPTIGDQLIARRPTRT